MQKITRGLAALAFGAGLVLIGAPSANAATVHPAVTCYIETDSDVGVTGSFTICPQTGNTTSVYADVKDTKADGKCGVGEVDWLNSANHIIKVDVTGRACPKGSHAYGNFTAPSGATYANTYVFTVFAS